MKSSDYQFIFVAGILYAAVFATMARTNYDRERINAREDEINRRMDIMDKGWADTDKKLDKLGKIGIVPLLVYDASPYEPTEAERAWGHADTSVEDKLESDYLDARMQEYRRTHDGGLK